MDNEERALGLLADAKINQRIESSLSDADVQETLNGLKHSRGSNVVRLPDNLYRHRGEYQCKAEKLFKAQKMYKCTRARCRKKGIPFNLTVEYLIEIFPDECPVFKMPFHMNEHGYAAMAPSIDKIIPELGYMIGNVQIISRKANMMKHDSSLAELYIFAQWAEKLYLSRKG